MTKAELVSLIAEQADINKNAATSALNAFVAAVQDSLGQKEGKIRVSGLGTFRVVKRKARNGVNPRTGEQMRIPAMKAPRFDAAKALKDAVQAKKKK